MKFHTKQAIINLERDINTNINGGRNKDGGSEYFLTRRTNVQPLLFIIQNLPASQTAKLPLSVPPASKWGIARY